MIRYMNSQKIIIDTDPGIDDSMAILSALRSSEFTILGLTTVFGNTDIDNCSQNGLRLVELEGNHQVPVAKGAGAPLVLPDLELGTSVHGLDGMGNTNPPPPTGQLDPRPAADFIVDTVKENPGEVILVPLGPLTNIALALHQEPGIASMVKEVVLMGGSVFAPGNISPIAEANIYHDPHAAEIVFRTDWDVTMIGLDVTTKIVVQPEDLEYLYAGNNPAVNLLKEIQPCYQQFHDQLYGLGGAFHLHDPSVVAYLLAPQLFTCIDAPVFVETSGLCAGKTIADLHQQWDQRRPSKIAVDADAKAVVNLLSERLRQ
jgi:inosine-uridine nucleoside N-ribohydrolase